MSNNLEIDDLQLESQEEGYNYDEDIAYGIDYDDQYNDM